MKLLQIGKYFPPVPGGMETAVFELCKGIHDTQSIEVTCLVSNTNRSTVVEKIDGFKVIRAGRIMKFASTSISWKFKKEFKNFKADLLHFHLPNPLATLACSGVNVPYVVTYHCDILRYKPLYKFYEAHMRNFLKKAQRIIVTSEMLIETSPVLKNFKDRCIAVPLALSTSSHLKLSAKGESFKKHLDKLYDKPLVLFVGRLVEYKGLDILIRSMATIEAKLVIVGSGPQKNILLKLVKKLNLENKVFFAGHVCQEELGAYYQACSLVALTSIDEREAFGMSLLEGLACGKPLLTTNLKTGVSIVNKDGVTGFQVPVNDVAAISSRINLLLSDPVLREVMGQNAKKHHSEHFGFEKMIASHIQIYNEALSV